MRFACLLLLSTSLSFAQARQAAPAAPNTLTPQQAAEGWLLLFDGETLFGWTKDGPAEWRAADGILVGEGSESGWLRTNGSFSEYLLKCEFRSGGEAGGLSLGGMKPIRAERKGRRAGEWRSYEVTVSGGKFLVTLDGKRVAGGKETRDIVGAIGLEHAKDSKVEYRNIKLKPLGLKPIFDGKDLTGWRRVDTPRAKEPPVWSVRDGMIHVEKGAGQLETDGQWADFILQLDVRTNTQDPRRHPNSGVFVRGAPNQFWSGYEAQIRNEWKDDDRSQPVDFGTGAIYGRQAARRVVSSDNEFFTMTVAARGRHIASWVNGFPVSDWTDPNPEGNSVSRKEAKLTAGAISLQAHDPTTNLDFKNIRIVELPTAEGARGAGR